MKYLAQGFLATTAFTWTFTVITLFRSGDAWLGLLYFLIFLIPLLGAIGLVVRKKKVSVERVSLNQKIGKILFSLLGIPLAFWAFDLVTTYYAVDVARLAVEINPLGWPLGILGALMYYGPTVIFMHTLLFKIKQKAAILAGIIISVVALAMGAMNFSAGTQNLGIFISTAHIAAENRFSLLALILAADAISVLAYTRLLRKQPMKSPEKMNLCSSLR